MIRVLVCGGRKYFGPKADETVFDTLNAIHAEHGIEAIIEGGATGADQTAKWWAYACQIKSITVKADWHTHGKAAGPIRNQRMIDAFKPDLVVAFPGGKGTADMVARAKKAGIPVKEIV